MLEAMLIDLEKCQRVILGLIIGLTISLAGCKTNSEVTASEPANNSSLRLNFTSATPADGTTVNSVVPLEAEASGDGGISSVDFFVDGNLIQTEHQEPYEATWDPGGLNGQHTISAVATDNSGNTAITTITVTVANPALPPSPSPTPNPPLSPPADQVPIPELNTWEQRMIEGGNQFCNNIPDIPNEQSVWYYDGIKVYYQIADYTGDTGWIACAENVVAEYRPYALGGADGWRVFSQGLRRHYEETGEPESMDAVLALAFDSSFSHLNLGNYHREHSYMVEALIDAWALTGEKPSGYDDLITVAIGKLEQGTDHPRGQAFMVGLMAEALIRHYEEIDSEDGRILPAVKAAVDSVWQNCGVAYTSGGNCGFWGPDVYLLTAPAFAWVYKMTADTQYRDQGDELFAVAAKDAYYGSGKQYSQSFHWSFDYVKWRSEAAAIQELASNLD